MGLNIKDTETERLATEVARLTGESKTRAIRVALQERRERLSLRAPSTPGGSGVRRFLEHEAWPQIPAAPGAKPITKRERERIVGYGKAGV